MTAVRVAPTSAEKRKLVRLLAKYIEVNEAPIHRQTKAYQEYFTYFEALEHKYPQVDFRSEAPITSLTAAAKRQASTKLFRGAGASW